MFLSQLMMCLSSASPALWHLCHVCLHLVALCRLLCLSNTFGSACSPNRNVRVSVQNPEIKNGCKQIQLVLTRNTIKSTCWGREHTVGAPSVCAALCTWKHRFLAFLSSETASGSSRRGKHQQFVEFRVGTERHSSVQATFMFCFEVSVCYSLASLSQPFILVPSCEESCRGRGTLGLLQLLWEQGCLQRGSLLPIPWVHCGNMIYVLLSLWEKITQICKWRLMFMRHHKYLRRFIYYPILEE